MPLEELGQRGRGGSEKSPQSSVLGLSCVREGPQDLAVCMGSHDHQNGLLGTRGGQQCPQQQLGCAEIALEAALVRHQQVVPGAACPGRSWILSLTLSHAPACTQRCLSTPRHGGTEVGDPLSSSTPGQVPSREAMVNLLKLSTLVGFSPGIMRSGVCTWQCDYCLFIFS